MNRTQDRGRVECRAANNSVLNAEWWPANLIFPSGPLTTMSIVGEMWGPASTQFPLQVIYSV